MVVLAVMVGVLLIARPTSNMPAPAHLALRPPAQWLASASPETPAPAATTRPLGRQPGVLLDAPPPSASIRELPPARPREIGGALPRTPVVYWVRLPRDSAQSP